MRHHHRDGASGPRPAGSLLGPGGLGLLVLLAGACDADESVVSPVSRMNCSPQSARAMFDAFVPTPPEGRGPEPSGVGSDEAVAFALDRSGRELSFEAETVGNYEDGVGQYSVWKGVGTDSGYDIFWLQLGLGHSGWSWRLHRCGQLRHCDPQQRQLCFDGFSGSRPGQGLECEDSVVVATCPPPT